MGKTSSYSWTKSRIFTLIKKYENAECLWNCNIDDYKSREKRETSISAICNNLNITREQFSKKIHNLRNQFNYEAKKLYKRNVEEKDESKPYYYSKWEYFNSLQFLKTVITPRPGFASSGGGIKYELQQISNFPNDEIGELSLSGKSFTDEHDDNAVSTHINVPIITDNDKKPTISPLPFASKELTLNEVNEDIVEENLHTSPSPIIIEEQQSGTQQIHHYDSPQIIEIQPCIKKTKLDEINNCSSSSNSNRNDRSEYDVFGEFVATELKSLNNVSSRKKLKRKIMEAILLVANEDD